MNILRHHNEIMAFLIQERAKNDLRFAVRKINNKNRLDNGYWFIGDESYLQVSFWGGGDSKRKIHNIGFTVLEDGTGYIQLSAKDSDITSNLLKNIAGKLGGFKYEGNGSWCKRFRGNDPVIALKKFLTAEKQIIDKIVKRNRGKGIELLSDDYDKKYVDRLIATRIRHTRIARICWNTYGWIKPSGMDSKSTHKKAYERINGFGYEEWLFDTGKLIDGYHYGFIQSIGSNLDKYVGVTFDLGLYTINSKEHKTYWLGRIRKAEVIDCDHSADIAKIYKEEGWLKEMHGDLAKVGVSAKDKLFAGSSLFNIRYKPEDLDLLEEMVVVNDKDVINSNYYSTMLITTKEPGYSSLLPSVDRPSLIDEEVGFDFKSGHTKKKKGNVGKKGHKSTTAKLLHNEIQDEIHELLSAQYGRKNVGTENKVGASRLVDIVVRHGPKEFTFYELKIGSSIKNNIREAFGQLLEYSCWPDNCYATKLVILSPIEPTVLVKQYVKNLRRRFRLPIYYQGYDRPNNTLYDEV